MFPVSCEFTSFGGKNVYLVAVKDNREWLKLKSIFTRGYTVDSCGCFQIFGSSPVKKKKKIHAIMLLVNSSIE